MSPTNWQKAFWKQVEQSCKGLYLESWRWIQDLILLSRLVVASISLMSSYFFLNYISYFFCVMFWVKQQYHLSDPFCFGSAQKYSLSSCWKQLSIWPQCLFPQRLHVSPRFVHWIQQSYWTNPFSFAYAQKSILSVLLKKLTKWSDPSNSRKLYSAVVYFLFLTTVWVEEFLLNLGFCRN